jgi:DNA polymerase
VPAPGEPLEAIQAELAGCQRCRLCEGRSNIVFGVGNPNAKLMFVGEGPGEDEDRTGEPFVGKAGQLLTKIIEAMGITRSDVYIANVVKCRPPGNRTPFLDEVEQCYPFLRRQIAALKPAIIVTLGLSASQALLEVTIPISRLRGNFYKYGEIKVMPTYHPAYLLRNPNEKRAVWDDMKKVMAELGLKAPAAK